MPISYLLGVLLLGLSLSSASAQPGQQCGEFFDLVGRYVQQHGKTFDGFTFQKGGRGDTVLLLFKEAGGPKVSKWVLFFRSESDVARYCVESDGIAFGVLVSVENNNFQNRYGMPGSGQPRCSSQNDPLGSLHVRMWANRELGQSTILYSESDNRSDFVYLINREQNWIITETKKDATRTTCYFNRGNNVVIRQNVEWRVDR